MRTLSIVLLATLVSGCLAPGERDPTRYPWDSRNRPPPAPPPHPRIEARGLIAPDRAWEPQPQPIPPESSYCIMAIEQERRTGSTVSANSGVMACSAPANRPPSKPRK